MPEIVRWPLAFGERFVREVAVIVSNELSALAIEAARIYRESKKGARLAATHVTLFCLPTDNEVTGELVLKVHGTSSVIRVPLETEQRKRPEFGGLFDEEERPPIQYREIDLGEDFVYVWEHQLPEMAVVRFLQQAREEEFAAR